MKRLAMSGSFLSAAFLLALLFDFQVARAIDVLYQGPDSGSWNIAANWSDGEPPTVTLNEAGVINNGATVVLSEHAKSGSIPPLFDVNVGGLRLGTANGSSGGLRITSGGNLPIVPSATGSPPETGAITVGAGTGTGTLTMIGNGILSGTSLSLGGSHSSSILLSDMASLTISGAANLERTTIVSGPSVNFSAGHLTLGSSSTLIADIRSATAHSPLRTEGAANVAGTIKPMFIGVTPSLGNKWTLIDAPSAITGEFAALDLSMAPALPVGQAYRLFQETVGARRLLQLGVQEVLVLQVNRQTGATSITNFGTQPKSLDGYSIISPHGSLTGTWNSLDDQNFGGFGAWVEAPPTANVLSEVYPNLPAPGSSAIGAGSSLQLGTPYVKTFPAFGVDPDDVSFEYTTPDERIIKGAVVYSGTKTANNFLLTVNPATGQAQLRLDSPIPTAIDGYAVYSASGSLTPATWNSLQDQSVAGWEQAPPAPAANAVAELRDDGRLTFQGQTGFQLGQLFKTVGGTQDLRLEVLLPGSDVPFVGQVQYGAFTSVSPPSVALVPGDYNHSGVVDGLDLDVWQEQFGLIGPLVSADGDQDDDADGHDFLIWQRNLAAASLPTTGSGDVNGNGVTDINDYIIIRNNFLGSNKTFAMGDLSGDAVVNFTDFRIWKNDREAAVAAAGAVPEPAGWALAAMGLGTVGAARRASRRVNQCSSSDRLSNCRSIVRRFLEVEPMASPVSLFGRFAACLLAAGVAGSAGAHGILYREDFNDAFLASNSSISTNGVVAGGTVSFNDVDNIRAQTSVAQTFADPVTTFSFDVVEPVTGATNDLLLRAADGTGVGVPPDADTIFEIILHRDGANRGTYANNGEESVFLVANNQAAALAFASPIDGAAVTLNPFNYITFVWNDATKLFSLMKDATVMVDQNADAPGVGDVTRFGIGNSADGRLGTFAIDNVQVVRGVTFAAIPGLPGDVDGDGVVEFTDDFSPLLINLRRPVTLRSEGDLTADGFVDFHDFRQWKAAFLGAGANPEGLDVPEPSGVMLIGLGVAIALRLRWQGLARTMVRGRAPRWRRIES
jgi:hypothetical protein